MTLFTLRGISKDFGIKQILKAASFSLEEGDKVGLIGTNGSGKSTLLKIIAGLEPFDSGDLWVNSSAKVMYLPQQPNLDDERTVLEQVFADCGEQMNLIREYELISHQLAHGSTDHDHDTLLAKLSHISQRIEALGAWDVETDAKVILTKLGIQDFDAKVGTLSGGYRKRIALATALLSAPDVLLMDEPTNHLDAISVEWLQTYLKRYQGALLLITHDRYFLDQVTNRILELDQGDLFSYSGNYAYYLGKKAEAEESNTSTQRKHAGVLRRELEWLKRGPKARSTKQKARIERVLAMKDQEFKQSQGKVEITTAGRRIGKKVVDLTGVFKGFEGRTLIRDFSYNFSPEDRIGIIGRNGAGKSTLMNMITGRLPADQGTVDIGTTVHFGYFDQHSDDLAEHGNQRVIDYLKSVAELVKTADGTIITASQMLERFLFNPNQQYAPIHKLSGGEKRRLFLLKVLMDAPNVLILDEPTNDLDVQTLGVLEEYLEEFNGCVIVVSHDRYFLDRTVEVVFAIESDGTIRQYPGNYSVYLECKKKEEESAAAAIATKEPPKSTAPVPATKQPPTTKPKKLSFKEKREYETLEAEIPQWETERAKLEKILYEKPPTGYSEVQKLTEQLGELVAKIDAATERWLDLAERYEA
ncbi:MAG: ABC-F family ATP-binding cassette domain-containing protein [Pseudanabaenaceae cyanobacterium]|jgi:ATP-binding cassette subfamily F protein uup